MPPDLGYPDNDYNKSGPRPTTFSVKFEYFVDTCIKILRTLIRYNANVFQRVNELWILY